MKPTCTQIRERLADLHDGLCTDAESQTLREHLEACAECGAAKAEVDTLLTTLAQFPEEEPGPGLQRKFDAMLREELRAEKQTTPRRGVILPFVLPAWGQMAAAACLLLVGGVAGAGVATHLGEAEKNKEQVIETRRQMAELQARMDSMNQMITYALPQQLPEGARLREMAALTGHGQAQPTRLPTLLGALAFDPSTNVRLSALEALYAHAGDPVVRRGVIASLQREQSPLVQIAMVDFLGSLNDPQAGEALRMLISAPQTPVQVREAARRAQALSL
jgi:anti-sigma factor RsiW